MSSARENTHEHMKSLQKLQCIRLCSALLVNINLIKAIKRNTSELVATSRISLNHSFSSVITPSNINELSIVNNPKAKKVFKMLFTKYSTPDMKHKELNNRISHLSFVKMCVDYAIIPQLINRASASTIFSGVLNDCDDKNIVNSADFNNFMFIMIKMAETMVNPLLADAALITLEKKVFLLYKHIEEYKR